MARTAAGLKNSFGGQEQDGDSIFAWDSTRCTKASASLMDGIGVGINSRACPSLFHSCPQAESGSRCPMQAEVERRSRPGHIESPVCWYISNLTVEATVMACRDGLRRTWSSWVGSWRGRLRPSRGGGPSTGPHPVDSSPDHVRLTTLLVLWRRRTSPPPLFLRIRACVTIQNTGLLSGPEPRWFSGRVH